MKVKNILLGLISIALLIVCINYIIVPYTSNQEKNLEQIPFQVALNSDDIVDAYMLNPNISDSMYTGKIIAITGFVKEVTFLNNRNTVLLYTKNKTSGVICDVHSNQLQIVKNLKKNQKISVKGRCKGFLKDVILLNCHIDLKPNE